MDEGKGADEGIDAVAVFKGFDVADNKRCWFIFSWNGAEPLHVDTEGSNRNRFGCVKIGLASHTMAGRKNVVSLLECESEQVTVEAALTRIVIDIAAPHRQHIGVESGEGTNEAETASIVGMQEVGTESFYLFVKQADCLEIYYLVEYTLRNGSTVAQHEVTTVYLHIGHTVVGRQVAAQQIEEQYLASSLAERAYPSKGVDAVGVG